MKVRIIYLEFQIMIFFVMIKKITFHHFKLETVLRLLLSNSNNYDGRLQSIEFRWRRQNHELEIKSEWQNKSIFEFGINKQKLSQPISKLFSVEIRKLRRLFNHLKFSKK